MGKEEKPDIIALQETGGVAKLPVLATSVTRDLAAIERDLGCNETENVFLELVPPDKREDSLFILHVYNHPKNNANLGVLLRKVVNTAPSSPLVVVGDFDAHHGTCGYKYDSRKEQHLWNAMQQCQLTLINNLETPTREGNSVCRDTSPDLTMTRNTKMTK